ncbi:MAG: hypothetical protein LBI02_03220 [Opitutaceae bacterium]|nr:hypothetical protein [Opitutaceae bacterium]
MKLSINHTLSRRNFALKAGLPRRSLLAGTASLPSLPRLHDAGPRNLSE